MEIEVLFILFLVLIVLSLNKSLAISLTNTILGKLIFIGLIVFFASKSLFLGLLMTIIIVIYSEVLSKNIETSFSSSSSSDFNIEGFSNNLNQKSKSKSKSSKRKHIVKERFGIENNLRIGTSTKNVPGTKTNSKTQTEKVLPSFEAGKEGFSIY